MASVKAEKLWSDAVRKAVHDYDEVPDGDKVKKVRRLNRIAETLVRSAIEGDMQAIKEVGDRLDGKPSQAMTYSSPDGGPIFLWGSKPSE